MNKIEWFYKFGEATVNTYLRTNYTIHHEGGLPKNEPYVLLPKHQKSIDIPLEGNFIRRQTARTANYVMRGFPFPFSIFLEALGGIQVARPKDVRKGKITTQQAHELNSQATQKVLQCLENGEPVIIHPEGTRSYKRMGEIRIRQGSILSTIIEEQQDRGPIPFIPMGIEYQGTSIWLRAGQPFYTNSTCQLEEHLRREIARLSRITCNNTGTQ